MADRAHSTIATSGATNSSPFGGDFGDTTKIDLSEPARHVPLERAPMSGFSISRRNMLATISALPIAALVPFSAAAKMPASTPDAPSMAVLVGEYDHITDFYEELIVLEESLSNQAPMPGVDVALKMERERGEKRLAFSPSEVRRHANRRFIALIPEQEPAVRAKVRAWTAEKLWELRAVQKGWRAFASSIGLFDARIAASAASEEQDNALARLALRRPRDAAEAQLKVDCLARHRIDADELGSLWRTMEAIFEHLCSIE